MLTPYQPVPVDQIDGSRFEQANCVCAVTADIIDRATLGRRRVSGATVRSSTGDVDGGIGYGQAATAAKALTQGAVELTVGYEVPRGTLRDGVYGGAPMGVSIYCRITRYTDRRTNWFTGFHTVYANDYDWTTTCRCEKNYANGYAHGEYLIDDPGTTGTGYLWWSSDLLYRAAEARTAAYGGHGINLLIGPDTENVSSVVREDGVVRKEPSRSSAKVGRITKGQRKRIRRTVNGGDWMRDTGGTAYAWAEIALATGGVGFVPGKRLKVA